MREGERGKRNGGNEIGEGNEEWREEGKGNQE